MVMPDLFPTVFIPVSTFVGIAFALFLWKRVSAVQMVGGQSVVRSQNRREYLGLGIDDCWEPREAWWGVRWEVWW